MENESVVFTLGYEDFVPILLRGQDLEICKDGKGESPAPTSTNEAEHGVLGVVTDNTLYEIPREKAATRDHDL